MPENEELLKRIQMLEKNHTFLLNTVQHQQRMISDLKNALDSIKDVLILQVLPGIKKVKQTQPRPSNEL